MPAQRDGVLAGHDAVVATLVRGGAGDVAGGEDFRMAVDPQVAVHLQPAEVVALGGDLLGEVAGAEAHGPDHGLRLDALAVRQHHAFAIHRRHRGAQAPFDAEFAGRLDDRRADAVAQRRADLLGAIDDNHPDIRRGPQYRPQPGGQLGGGFDAGEAAAGHHHGVARGRFRQVGQLLQVPLQARRRFDLVDVEGMFHHADRGRPNQPAARGEHQTVVADPLRDAGCIAVLDPLPIRIHRQRGALDEAHADGIQQLQQRRAHALHVRLVEARADAQFRLRREHAHHHIVVTPMTVEQTHGAERTPQTRKARTNNENMLFHRSPLSSG
ncbi:hypothetical protein D9M71_269510 [compost metagenome]